MKRIFPAITGLVFVAASAGAQTPMKVYVTAAKVQERKEVDEATKNALKAKKDAAKEARKAKENEIKAAHGKKKEEWPPEKQEEFFEVDEAAALAEADYEYRKVEIKGINDSVQDVIESIQGKGLAGRKDRIALASSAEEADLVVEVRARRSGKTLPTQIKADRCYVLFTLGPGGKLDAERFAKVPRTTGREVRRRGLPAGQPQAREPGVPLRVVQRRRQRVRLPRARPPTRRRRPSTSSSRTTARC